MTIKLPPLPLEDIEDGEIRVWTTKHLQAYAIAAIEAYKQQGEPVAQWKPDAEGGPFFDVDAPSAYEQSLGWEPLYTHPAPAQQQGEAVATLTMFDMRSQTGTVDLCGNWQELRVGDALYTRPAQHERVQSNEWQPIDTAPKDGRRLLLATPRGKMADGNWEKTYKVWSWPYVMVNPTHWMPAPLPPAHGIGGEK
jgi:hypothetical protein